MADIPGASIYGQANLQAKNAYQNALARINQQRGSTLRSFGYTGDFDQESGVLKNMKVDPFNKFGGYQQMLKSHAEAAQQGQDMARERGLSASGGLGAQYERDAQWNFGKDSANLGQQLGDNLFQLQDQQNQAKYDYDQALWQAQLEAARNAVEQGDFTDTGYGPDYSEPDYTDYGQYNSESPTYVVPGQQPNRGKITTMKQAMQVANKAYKSRPNVKTNRNTLRYMALHGGQAPPNAKPIRATGARVRTAIAPKKPTQKGRR